MREPTCDICGGKEFVRATEVGKAKCHIQYLIQNHKGYCVNCMSDEMRKILDNPSKSCPCPYKHPRCLDSLAEGICIDGGYDIDDHTSVWGGAGPDCINGQREAAQ